MASPGGDRAEAIRRRVGHPGGNASTARVHLRVALDASCPPAFRAPVSLPARQSGYNKRLRRAAAPITPLIKMLAADTPPRAHTRGVGGPPPGQRGRPHDPPPPP